MKKKLTAKIQQLAPNLGENETQLSNCITIEPEDKEVLLKKGSLYAVFDLTSNTAQNASLISKLSYDVLNELYYQSDNISPIQSLEKAISALNEKLTQLPNAEEKTENKFNIVAGVLWGNVLYVVHFGSSKSYLMREGEIKEVSTTTEGNYSVASGVVKNDDVVVLCTESFAKKYPPEKLLSTAIAPNELGATQSSLLMKFMINEELTQDEVIDFNVKKENKTPKIKAVLSNLKTKRLEKKKKEQTINTLAGIAPETSKPQKKVAQPPVKKPIDVPDIKIKTSLEPRFKIKKIIPVVIILLLISVAATIIYNSNKTNVKPVEPQQENSNTLSPPQEPEKDESTESSSEPEVLPEQEAEGTNNVRVAQEAFYDIKLADSAANPTEIAVFNNTVVVADKNSGKMYTSANDTPKFDAEENTFEGIEDIVNYNGTLHFKDATGYKEYDLVNSNLVSEDAIDSLGITNTYLGNIYSIEGTTLNKYVSSGGTVTKSVWAESSDFTNAKAMEIAYSIYVADSNSISVYTQGNRGNFEVTDLPKQFREISDLVVNVDYDNIYVADKGNNRIVVLDTNGKYIKEFTAENNTAFNDIRSISVNPSETIMFVLSGSKVYEIDLTDN